MPKEDEIKMSIFEINSISNKVIKKGTQGIASIRSLADDRIRKFNIIFAPFPPKLDISTRARRWRKN